MKKLVICLLILSLALCSFAACKSDDVDYNSGGQATYYPYGTSQAITVPGGTQVVNGFAGGSQAVSIPAVEKPELLGQKIYNDLVTASELCETYRNAVYNAWFFAIYEFDDYTSSQKLESPQSSTIVADFARKVGISPSEIRSVVANYPEGLGVIALSDFNASVAFVLSALEKNGTKVKLETALSSAKNNLKNLTEKYSSYDESENLKKFYTEVNAYAEYLKNPTGSFETMKSTTQTHQNSVRTAKSALDFAFGD